MKSNLSTYRPMNSFKKFHARKRQIGYLSKFPSQFLPNGCYFWVPEAIADVRKRTLAAIENCFIGCCHSFQLGKLLSWKANVTSYKTYFIIQRRPQKWREKQKAWVWRVREKSKTHWEGNLRREKWQSKTAWGANDKKKAARAYRGCLTHAVYDLVN